MIPVLLFLRKHWKFVACLVALVAVFFAGRASVPEVQPIHIEGKEKIVEKKVIDELLVEQEVKKRVAEIETKLKKRIVETKITKPDGTKIETKVVDLNIDTKQKEVEVQAKDREERKVEYIDRVTEKEVLVDVPRKNWLVGPIVGLDMRSVGFENGGLKTGALGIGAQVQRRIVGPVYLGAWGTHTGNMGVGVSFEF